jgi:hypothetical protein
VLAAACDHGEDQERTRVVNLSVRQHRRPAAGLSGRPCRRLSSQWRANLRARPAAPIAIRSSGVCMSGSMAADFFFARRNQPRHCGLDDSHEERPGRIGSGVPRRFGAQRFAVACALRAGRRPPNSGRMHCRCPGGATLRPCRGAGVGEADLSGDDAPYRGGSGRRRWRWWPERCCRTERFTFSVRDVPTCSGCCRRDL